MVKKFFFKNGSAVPRRLFKYDLLGLFVPKRGIHVEVCPATGMYLCTLIGRSGDVFIQSSSADKLISVVRDCFRESSAARFFNNDFYKSLTFIFVNA